RSADGQRGAACRSVRDLRVRRPAERGDHPEAVSVPAERIRRLMPGPSHPSGANLRWLEKPVKSRFATISLADPSGRGRPHYICAREVPGGPRLARVLSRNPRQFRISGYEGTNRLTAVHP